VRILYVINSVEGGGAALPVPAIVEVLRRAGAEVALRALTRRDGRAMAAMAAIDLDVHVRPGGEKDHFAALRWLDREAARWRPTHIWTSLSRATLLGQIVGQWRRVPVVSWQHAAFLKPANLRLLRLLRHERVTTIFEPVDAPDAMSADRPTAEGRPTIVSAGRLVAQKNMALALDAFARFPDRSARLIVAGDGPQRGALEEQAARLGIAERVTFTGHVPGIAPLLEHAHLFLATSVYEGYPAVLIEAIAAGVPIVTTGSSPAIAEILAHPSFGIQAEADPPALADAMRHVLDGGKPDADARAAFLARHDPDRAALAWLAVLDDAVRRRFNATHRAAR